MDLTKCDGKQGLLGPARHEESGVALLLALVFIALLSVLIVDFSYEMQVEATLVSSAESDFRAYLAAKSAVSAGMGLLAADLLEGEAAVQPDSVEVYDSLDEAWALGVPLETLNNDELDPTIGDAMQATIADEFGKLNLNALVYSNEESGEEQVFELLAEALRYLFEQRGGLEDPVDALIDWLDRDDEPGENGAETDYYASLGAPYSCKNGPMDSLEELLLIPGIDIDEYLGDPENELLPLSELLTVHGHPEGRVNVNTAPSEVLEAVFTADAGSDDAEARAVGVLDRRENVGPYMARAELEEDDLIPKPPDPEDESGQVAPTPAAVEEDGEEEQRSPVMMLDWASGVFRIYGHGESGGAKVRIAAYVWRDTHRSGATQMFRIVDWQVVR